MGLGTAIKVIRIARKMGQQELADRAIVSCSLISLIENGLRLPGIDTLISIAKALDVPVTVLWFMTEQDQVELFSPSAKTLLAVKILSLFGPMETARQTMQKILDETNTIEKQIAYEVVK